LLDAEKTDAGGFESGQMLFGGVENTEVIIHRPPILAAGSRQARQSC
jgi:hypothetical protein